ncbi:MAG: hypothetical protein H6625_06740 [Bdellovibrionaceae bacterium]|nr:hypothetical protein [Pseudobdellovibrionaceae bacterium]MCB9093231.1 hypothetical protein [Halobacteriovoraceae bacterium]
MKNKWEPRVRLIPNKVSTDEHSLNLDELASIVYDYFCQLQKSKSDQFLRIESQTILTHSDESLKRTGTDA